ncbi:MAG: trigger factor [Treponema sp.]|nr:trigger factor [Treponema sp.]
MTISKEITRLEHSAINLTITVAQEDVRAQYDGALSEYAKTLQMPGFRKGKVPKSVLERKLGEALKGEVLARILEKAVTETMEDETFPKADRPLRYSTPALQGTPRLDLEADFVFSLVYDVFPQFTLGTWQGFEIEIPEVSVTGEDLSRELEAVRERNAFVVDKDDDAQAVTSDVVTVNYSELSDDGEPVAGTEREDFVFTLGSGHNLFKFDDEVVGMKKGETRDIEKVYPQDFVDESLAGTTKKIRVTLTALKEKNLPELNDDLAQDVDEKYETLEDLKNSIKTRLEGNLDKRLQEIKVGKLLAKIMETTPVDIPESMIRIELDARWQQLVRQLKTDSETLADSMQKSGVYEQLREEWRGGAINILHSRLVMEALIGHCAIEATEADIEAAFETVSAEGTSSVEAIKAYYESENALDMLREDIRERKLFERLISENTIKVGNKENYLDLVANNGKLYT